MPHLKQLSELMDKGIGLGLHPLRRRGAQRGESGGRLASQLDRRLLRGSLVHQIRSGRRTSAPFPKNIRSSNGVRPFVTTRVVLPHALSRKHGRRHADPSAVPPDKTRERRDDDPRRQSRRRAGSASTFWRPRSVVSERPGDGRGFGCTGGHQSTGTGPRTIFARRS